MKKTLSLLLAFAVGLTLQAQQTFTAVNADGVTITYKTTSDSTVEVARDSYSGRVVVPESVTYEGTEYSVTKVGARAFYNSAVSYVELPATLSDLGLMCLAANSLDSVRFNSPEPPARANYTMVEILDNKLPERVTVIVPCGRLERWKENGWRVVKFVKSDCAHRLTVTPTFDNLVRVDSVVFNGNAVYSNGYYEAGDTARLYAQRINQDNNGNTVANHRFGYFIGWSTGSGARYATFVMPDHDMDVECIVDTMPRATLSASRITTPVYTFGTLGYDGEVTDFRFRDLHYYTYDENNEVSGEVWPSTLFASSIWLSASDEACAVSRFFNNGSDFIPGPLRLDGTTDLATARRYSRVWHVTREMIDYHIAHCGEAGYTVPDDIMTWPGNGPDGYADQLAPYYDADGNGHYWAPAGDYPIIRGDECVYSIFNDLIEHSESNGNSMGVEVHCMTYAFDEPQDSVLWNSVFQHYDIYNRSQSDYDSVYLGMFTDFDIGYAWDDYIGCHVQYDMYYGYNGTVTDNSFPYTPPAQGTLILSADGQPGMTSFLAYDNVINGVMGEPVTASDYRNYLQGRMKNGNTPWSGPNGEYPFMYPAGSDPAFGYVDEMSEGNAPGDRRGVGGSGPYSLASGASQSFDVAFLTAWTDVPDCVGCSRSVLVGQAPDLRRQWLRDTTDSGRPFVYMPYSAPHEVGIEGADAASLRVYPNPTTGRLTVSLPVETDVEVHDMMGRRLMAVHARQGAVALDLTALPQGVYLLRAAGAVSRVVKQ